MRLLNLSLTLVVLALCLAPSLSYSLRKLGKSSVVVSSNIELFNEEHEGAGSKSASSRSSKSASASPSSSSQPSWSVEQVQAALNKNAQAWAASFLEQASAQVKAVGKQLPQIVEQDLAVEFNPQPMGELSLEWAAALKAQINEDFAQGTKDIKDFSAVQQVGQYLQTEEQANANNAEFELYDQVVNFVDQGLWMNQENLNNQAWADIVAGYNAVFENIKGDQSLKATIFQILQDSNSIAKLKNDAKYNPNANTEVDSAQIAAFEQDVSNLNAELKANPEFESFNEQATAIAGKWGLLPSGSAAPSSSKHHNTKPKF